MTRAARLPRRPVCRAARPRVVRGAWLGCGFGVGGEPWECGGVSHLVRRNAGRHQDARLGGDSRDGLLPPQPRKLLRDNAMALVRGSFPAQFARLVFAELSCYYPY